MSQEGVAVVCLSPLTAMEEGKLKEHLRRVPHRPLKSVVGIQLFCGVWGGRRLGPGLPSFESFAHLQFAERLRSGLRPPPSPTHSTLTLSRPR